MDVSKGLNTFTYETVLPVSQQELFAWHMQPDAFEKLTPPKENVKVVKPLDAMEKGQIMILKIQGIFPWKAQIEDVRPPHEFIDVQLSGPFAYWRHRHRFEKIDEHNTKMRDEISYRLPWGLNFLGGWLVKIKLRSMFAYRHDILKKEFIS